MIQISLGLQPKILLRKCPHCVHTYIHTLQVLSVGGYHLEHVKTPNDLNYQYDKEDHNFQKKHWRSSNSKTLTAINFKIPPSSRKKIDRKSTQFLFRLPLTYMHFFGGSFLHHKHRISLNLTAQKTGLSLDGFLFH